MKLRLKWTCSDRLCHHHRWRWSAWLCGRIQRVLGIEWLSIHYRTARDYGNSRWLSRVKAVRIWLGIPTYLPPPSERRRLRRKYRGKEMGT